MHVDVIGTALFLVTCLLAVAIAHLWVDTRILIFRSEIFRLRDDLFLDAAEGRIGFDDPAYVLMRRMMNGAIRFAPRLSLLMLALVTSRDRDQDAPSFAVDRARADEQLSVEQRAMLARYERALRHAILRHLRDRNPVLCPVAHVLRRAFALSRRMHAFTTRLTTRVQELAFAEGHDAARAA